MLWTAVDCETTGLLPRARLLELAAITFDSSGRVLQTFHSLVRPATRIPKAVGRLTGISWRDVRHAPPPVGVMEAFLNWLPQGAIPVAHNADFDRSVLEKEAALAQLSLPHLIWIDSVAIAGALNETADKRLSTIAAHHRWRREHHRALSDANLVRMLVLHALQRGLDKEVPHLLGLPP